MAEIAASFVEPVIEAAVKWVGAPIIRQFNYLCCFTTNIATLTDEAQKLDDATKGLQGQVDRERENIQIIVPEVETWITNSNDFKKKMNGILDEATNVGSGCLKLRARFSLSKRAKKTTDHIIELLGKKKFDTIAHRGPSAAMEVVPLGMNTYRFESRKQIEEEIMKSLRDGERNMIAICGMGGLGKTTMAKIIKERALEEHVFEEVVMVVVSQPVDKLKIQVEIGGSLNLKLEGETSEVRVQKLHARLTTAGTKRILLVLDDVWERLELEDLGIPCGSKGCTILLTSRNSDVLSAMNVQKVLGMQVLSEEDAWLLFSRRTGTCVDDTKLNSLAKEVVEECRGLPIALTTVGAVLKDEKNVCIWKDALRQLTQSDPDIPDIIAKVYNPLKLSYDALGSKHAKSVFLLCCLFGEDAHIRLEYLTYFCMGLGIFEGGIRNMEEARNRMSALTKMLKSRSLLLDSDEEDCVRMHDVVHDVCIFIAKQKGYICGNDCTWISSSLQQIGERTELSTNLHLLYLSGNSKLEEQINKFDNFSIEAIRDLHVLSIENYSSLTSVPHKIHSIKNLKTLVFDSCSGLETISFVGELVHLEILVCRGCHSLREIPPEIKRLNHLKLLDLTECEYLQSIGRDIISSLVGLEELKMLYSFDKWEAAWDIQERENIGNANLRELEALTNLTTLEIDIDDTALAAENMRLSSKLERFQIRIPTHASIIRFHSSKKLSLELKGETGLGDWIEMSFLRDTECLHLRGNGATNVDLSKCQNIRWLNLVDCNNMKNIGRTSMDDATIFPFIEHLKLRSLPELEEICDGPISSNSFYNLKELHLKDLSALKQLWKSSSSPIFHYLSSIKFGHCPRLRNLGQFSIGGKDCLSQLQTLVIWDCEMMEQVFLWNEEGEWRTTKLMFPKLKKIELSYLPNLVALCQGIGGIEFPLLTTMSIKKCPKMNIVIGSNQYNSGGSSSSNNAHIDHNHSSHLFCQPQKVSFNNLKELEIDQNPFYGHKIPVSFFNGLEELIISGYEASMSLFSFSIAANLVSLRVLSICECDEMVQVMQDEEEKVVNGGKRTLVFSSLIELRLSYLRKLESFCDWNCDVGFPSLRKVDITMCPNFKSFTLAAPNLEDFTTDLNKYLEDGVLNVSFDSLKRLIVEGNENPLYTYKIHASLFIGLQELRIYQYEGNMTLFSFSIAKNLVNLKQLKICTNYKMLKVIDDEKEEENVVSGGAQTTTTILFPKLQEIELSSLWALESFCEWKCDVELPSMREVFIWSCPNMKIFSLGSLTTPKLEIIQIDNGYVDGEKDLNGALKQHILLGLAKAKVRATSIFNFHINSEDFSGEKDLNDALK